MSFDRSLTRGPLPASVYWRRRAAVLGIAVLLIVGVVRMFNGDGDGPGAAAVPAASSASVIPVVPDNIGAPDPSASASAGAAPSAAASPTAAATPTAPATSLPAVATALPTPTGRCSDDDVSIVASISKAEATRVVPIRLTLRTALAAACLWDFGPKSVQVDVTSGSDQIWSTLECPKALVRKTLTLRRDTPVTVQVNWNSRRSDSTCSAHTQWAQRGYYHARVAALGGEPSDLQFRLVTPSPIVKTPKVATTKPTGTATGSGSTGSTSPKNPASKAPRAEPTGEPVRPD